MSICLNYRVILATTDNSNADALVVRPRCKMWSCEHCAVVNRNIWQARIGLEIERHECKWYFLTFTLLGKYHDKGGRHSDVVWREQVTRSLGEWRNSWDKLMKRMRRGYGSFSYLRVFETHADGTLHVHVLCNADIDDAREVERHDGSMYWHSDTILRHVTELGLGYIHDARPLAMGKGREEQGKMIASYVAKYLTKDIQNRVRQALSEQGLGRVRVIQTSRGWANLPNDYANRAWGTAPITWDDAMVLWRSGHSIIDLNRGFVVDDGEQFGEYGRYPNPDSELLYKLGE